MTHFSSWFQRAILIAGFAAVAFPLQASTVLLNLQGSIATSSFPDIPVGLEFSMSMQYDPATPASVTDPGQSLFSLTPGPLSGTAGGGTFLAQNSKVQLVTQQSRTCFNDVLNQAVSCSVFLMEADFAPGDLSGTFSTDQVSHFDIFFEDDSSSLVSEFALPTLPFPPVSAWTAIYFSASQNKEGGDLFAGTVRTLTASSSTTPEPAADLMAAVGLLIIGMTRLGRRATSEQPNVAAPHIEPRF